MKAFRFVSACAYMSSAAMVSGCAGPQVVQPVAYPSVASHMRLAGATPSLIDVNSLVESDTCRGLVVPNGRRSRLSDHVKDVLLLSQMVSGAPATDSHLAIQIDSFVIECGRVPAFVQLKGWSQYADQPKRTIDIKEAFDFAFGGLEITQNMTQAFDAAVEKFADEAVRHGTH